MRARALPLAQVLAAWGHTVTLVVPPWDNPTDSGRIWAEGPVRVVNVPVPPAIPLLGHLLLALRLLWIVLRLRPDVVHAFKPKGFSALVAQALLATQVLGLRRGIRLAVDTDDWEGEGGWNDVEPYPWWQKRLFAWQERWLLRHAPAVTCASTELMRMTVAVRGTESGVTYVPNGCSAYARPDAHTIEALRRRLELPAGLPVLLLYTRFVECPPKRFTRLLRFVQQRGTHPTVLLVGVGLRGEEALLRSGLEAAGVTLPLVQAGWVPAVDLPAYLALADVALFPMEDTLINRTKCSVKLIDLLSAGVPVVAEAVGQAGAYIRNGVSGLLTSAGDDEALADAVAVLLADPARRQALGAAAGERMQRDFSWQQVAAPLSQVYTPS